MAGIRNVLGDDALEVAVVARYSVCRRSCG
jgi:hypothetical protein